MHNSINTYLCEIVSHLFVIYLNALERLSKGKRALKPKRLYKFKKENFMKYLLVPLFCYTFMSAVAMQENNQDTESSLANRQLLLDADENINRSEKETDNPLWVLATLADKIYTQDPKAQNDTEHNGIRKSPRLNKDSDSKTRNNNKDFLENLDSDSETFREKNLFKLIKTEHDVMLLAEKSWDETYDYILYAQLMCQNILLSFDNNVLNDNNQLIALFHQVNLANVDNGDELFIEGNIEKRDRCLWSLDEYKRLLSMQRSISYNKIEQEIKDNSYQIFLQICNFVNLYPKQPLKDILAFCVYGKYEKYSTSREIKELSIFSFENMHKQYVYPLLIPYLALFSNQTIKNVESQIKASNRKYTEITKLKSIDLPPKTQALNSNKPTALPPPPLHTSAPNSSPDKNNSNINKRHLKLGSDNVESRKKVKKTADQGSLLSSDEILQDGWRYGGTEELRLYRENIENILSKMEIRNTLAYFSISRTQDKISFVIEEKAHTSR